MNHLIKVAEIIPRLEFGGVESVVLNYIKNLPNRNDFEIHVIAQNIYDEECIRQFEDLGIKIHLVTHKRTSLVKNCNEIWNILKKECFDVVHSHMTLTNFYVLFMAKMLGVEIRISHSHNAFFARNLKQKIIWKFLKFLNKIFANVLMACGYDAGEFLFGNRAINTGNVIILNNAINEEQFRYKPVVRKKIREELKINDEFVIGHIGRFVEQKNHIFLIDVFNSVLSVLPEAKLLLVGAGELQNLIYEKVQKLNIEKSVIFTGNVTNPQDYYQAMDVFVLPSLFEGLPVVSVEAQAAGLPCLISDNVDRRCKVTSDVEFLSINQEKDLWAKSIVSYKTKKRNAQAIDEIISRGYSISVEVKKLEKVYRGII